MADSCDACGRDVPVAGGISGFWNLDQDRTGGIALTFEDDSEHFLCFDCVDALPDYPTDEDVAALRRERRDE